MMPQSILKTKDSDNNIITARRPNLSPFKVEQIGPDLLSKPKLPAPRLLRINGKVVEVQDPSQKAIKI
jgi:hypothetical protein